MKSQLIAIVAAVLVVGCGTTQQSAPTLVEVKPAELVAEASQPEPSTQKELHKKSCYNQLKRIDGVKEMWATMEKRAVGYFPLKPKSVTPSGMACPPARVGGVYTIGAVGNQASCSIPRQSRTARYTNKG